MIFIYFILFFILLIIYYFSNKESQIIQEGFLPSDKFTGAKKGYVFKKCSKGIGYYKDKK
jgi:hypothetical protein